MCSRGHTFCARPISLRNFCRTCAMTVTACVRWRARLASSRVVICGNAIQPHVKMQSRTHARERTHTCTHTHTHTSGPRRCPRTWSRNFEVYSLLQATPSSSAWEPTMIWSCLAAGEAAGEAGALIAPADALRLSSSPNLSQLRSGPDVHSADVIGRTYQLVRIPLNISP